MIYCWYLDPLTRPLIMENIINDVLLYDNEPNT